MDINQALADARGFVKQILTEGETDDELAVSLAETFDGIDEWLTKKGFQPDAWS
jgi:hypothetical protein